jgi:hypothetical protein
VERPASELVGPDAQENFPGRNALQREGRPGQPEQCRTPLVAVLERSGTEIRVVARIAFPCGHAVQGSGTREFETAARPGLVLVGNRPVMQAIGTAGPRLPCSRSPARACRRTRPGGRGRRELGGHSRSAANLVQHERHHPVGGRGPGYRLSQQLRPWMISCPSSNPCGGRRCDRWWHSFHGEPCRRAPPANATLPDAVTPPPSTAPSPAQPPPDDAPEQRDSPESKSLPRCWLGLDRLGVLQVLGGLARSLIALFSSYDHITLLGRTFRL